ncbi:MAG: DUF3794 domain-containing protein [Oscillospiraceae bacterium]|jgi:hypothetical protein
MRAALHCCEYDEQKLIFETEVSREETLELVVPDVCADIAAVLDARGQLLLASKKTGSNAVIISASVDVKVICAAEDGRIQCVSGVIPFDQSIPAEGVTENDSVIVRCRLMAVEARTLNPRRLLLRAEVMFCCEVYTPQRVSLCDGPAPDADASLHVLQKTFACCPVRTVRDKSFSVSDEYTLPEERGKNLKLLSTVTEVNVDDVKGVGSKLIVKARTETNAVFLNVDGDGLFSEHFSTAFTQIIEVEAAGDAFDDTVHLQLRDAEFTCLPGREGGFAVSAQMFLTAQAVRREKCERTYVADAYSNSCALRLTSAQVRSVSAPERKELRFDMQEKLPQKTPLSELSYLTVSTVSAEADGGFVTLRARLSGEGTDADGQPAPVFMELYSRQEFPEKPGARVTVLSVAAETPSVLGAAGEASVMLGVVVSCAVSESVEISAVTALAVDEDAPAAAPGPSLVVVCSQRECDLWTLAKKYASTTDAIVAANGGESGFSLSRRPLLIPRAH